MRSNQFGDGDACPQDLNHGTMYFLGNGTKRTQWCPHSSHRGEPYYQFDGVTPLVRVPSPAPDAPLAGASGADDGTRHSLTGSRAVMP